MRPTIIGCSDTPTNTGVSASDNLRRVFVDRGFGELWGERSFLDWRARGDPAKVGRSTSEGSRPNYVVDDVQGVHAEGSGANVQSVRVQSSRDRVHHLR
jgi:hypothetical protein